MSAELDRRHALQGAAVAVVAAPVLAACGNDEPVTATDPGAQSSADGTPDVLTSTGDIPEGGGKIFTDEKVVVTQPTAGEFKCFSAVCTHQGCLVSEVTETIDCRCHMSKFSLTDGSPVSGPASAALGAVEISVDGDSISLV